MLLLLANMPGLLGRPVACVYGMSLDGASSSDRCGLFFLVFNKIGVVAVVCNLYASKSGVILLDTAPYAVELYVCMGEGAADAQLPLGGVVFVLQVCC